MDYATQLRKAFKEAYPEEDVGSAVLLQTFLSGLRPSIARQVMLKGRPTALDKAIEEAVTVEEVCGLVALILWKCRYMLFIPRKQRPKLNNSGTCWSGCQRSLNRLSSS